MAVVGIDVSKRSFDVAFQVDGRWKCLKFANSADGVARFQQELGGQYHACMEATGRYGRLLAQSLFEAGHIVSVVNPLRIQRYAESRLRRTKTDKADAILIAEFCDKEHPGPWKPLPEEVEALRELVRRREHLLGQRQMERNRLLAGPCTPGVQASIQRALTFVAQELKVIEADIERTFKTHGTLQRQRELLVSIPGIGNITAAILLAEIGDVREFPKAKSLSAFAGLNPKEHTSGTSVKGRAGIAKMGNPRLRRVLYMAALSAKRKNPVVKDFTERLALTKPKKLVHVAAMRKLLHIAYGVLIREKPFTPEISAQEGSGD